MKRDVHFGGKIRKIRERRGITMKEVAVQIGVSESLVSQIERNKVSPSVDTLINIADVLEIDLDYLFRDFKRDKGLVLIKPEERNIQQQEGVIYEYLSLLSDKNENYAMEAFILRIAPGTERGDEDYGHPGKELGLILEGSGEILYGKTRRHLEKGDCISFSSDIPHSLKNTGTTELAAVWIITPPKST